VTTTVLVGDEARRGHEELCLHEGRHVGEVEVASRAPKSPGGRVIRARDLLRCVVRAEGLPEAADAKLQVEGAVGARVYSAEPDYPRRRGGTWRARGGKQGAWREKLQPAVKRRAHVLFIKRVGTDVGDLAPRIVQ
jgi:hypothetical protein